MNERHLKVVPTPERLRCEVCFDEPAAAVAASGIADTAVAFGARCIDQGAEPMRLVAAFKAPSNGKIIDGLDRWFLDGITVYVAPTYMTVREWNAAGRPGLEIGTTAHTATEGVQNAP